MSLEGITASVSNWLKRQHVLVLDEWVKACVEWLKSEYKEALNNPTELQQLVYEQWLDSDLADVATPCLPNGIAQQQKGLLNGNYILQINSLRDVSTPAYGQLIKLRGQENENAKVTATQQTQSRFEPKSNRMLMLQLTDGHQSLQGMEFEPIPGLSVSTSPGTKIQVCGSVQCRLGVLLLSPQNVKVLGGEVDALVTTNNQDAVLAQALRQPSIPLDQQTAQPTQQDQPQTNQLPRQQQAPHQQQAGNQVIDLTDDEPVTNVMSGTRQHVQSTRQQNPTSGMVEDDPLMDGFDDDDDFDEIMLQGLEEIELQQGQPGNNQQTGNMPPHQQQQRNSVSALVSNTTYNSPLKIEIKVSMPQNNSIPQDPQIRQRTFLGQHPTTSASGQASASTADGFQQPKENKPSGLSSHSNKGNVSNLRPNMAVAARITKQEPIERSSGFLRHSDNSQSASNRTGQSVSSRTDNLGSNHPNHHQGRPFLGAPAQENRNWQNKIKQEFSSSSTSGPSSSTSRLSRQGFVKFDPSDQPGRTATGSSVFQPLNSTVKSESGHQSVNQDRKPNSASLARGFAPAISIVKQEHCENKSNQFQSAYTAQVVKTEPADFGRTAQGLSRGASASNLNIGSSKNDDEIMMAKRRRFFSGQNSDATGSLPYSSLSLASRKWEARENCVMHIKGFIMTLVSSLTCKKGWNVVAKINDGTASMDVDLGNEVLTKLIGFSVLELMQKKKAASTATSERQAQLKKEMQQGLEKCQQALIDMSCIMTLEIRPEYERPRVLTIREINNSDCLTLIHQL